MIASLSKYFMNIPEDEKVLNHSIICRYDNEVIFPKFMENTSRIDYRTLFETIFDNESENAYHIDFLSDKWDFYPLVKNGNVSALRINFSEITNINFTLYLKYYAIYLLAIRNKPSSVCLKIRQMIKIFKDISFVETFDISSTFKIIKESDRANSYKISILSNLLDFISFIKDNFGVDYNVDIVKFENDLNGIVADENRYPLIPWEYFNKMMDAALHVMSDENMPLMDRITACALIIQMQSGLRTVDLISLEMDDLVIEKDGEDCVYFINYYQNKTSKMDQDNYMLIDVSESCGRAFEKARELRIKPLDEKDRKLLITKKGKGFSSSNYMRLYHGFMVKYLGDEIYKPWENIEKRKLRVNKYGIPWYYEDELVEAYVPYPHSFRVNICTMITESNMYTRKYCMKHLGHLSDPMDNYYVRPKDRTSEINKKISSIVGNMVRYDVAPLGGRNDGENITKNIQDYLKNGGTKAIEKKILTLSDEDLIRKLGGRLSFNPVAGGCCIKVGDNTKCNLYGNDNNINCAYGQCENLYYFFFNLPETLASFRMAVNAYTLALMKNMNKQAEKSNKSARNLASKLNNEVKQLNTVKHMIDGFDEKYPNLVPYLSKIEDIEKEIKSWL